METPVIYFYSPRETSVSVRVSFAKGLITEWYPHAHVQPDVVARRDTDGEIRWERVKLLPDSHAALPNGDSGNEYFAARETSATPVRVAGPSGEQDEKFLFYRGVSSAPAPATAQLQTDGRVMVRSSSGEIPAIIRIESRGGKLGYRLARAVSDSLELGEPPLTSSRSAMLKDLEGILVAQGLYVQEARAMIATWRNSWFEEGSRLLYIVPAQVVDALLPLAIDPAPGSVARVFVGRMELVTAATEKAVETAFAANDRQTLDQYHRFLEPILNAMIAGNAGDSARLTTLTTYLNSVLSYACRSPWPDAR
jgi:hypothetical protein